MRLNLELYTDLLTSEKYPGKLQMSDRLKVMQPVIASNGSLTTK
jgi:hypothetical protein